MTEYATPTNTSNPVFNPRLMWQVTGFALTAVALLGLIINFATDGFGPEYTPTGIENFLQFDMAHNVLHVVLAGLALTFGFANIAPKVSKLVAIVVGAVYLVLATIGFIGGLEYNLFGLDLIQLELGENLVHLLIGAWALTSGLVAKYD